MAACVFSLFMARANAQETYENTKVIDNDLNGTARYVGMGGAMEALGADISTVRTNPAGIGLFRSSSASVSFGLVSQDKAPDFRYGNKTNMSFDQGGFVYASRGSNGKSFLNFAINYTKSKNFDYILAAAGGLNGSSQNRLSFIKALGDLDASGLTSINIEKSGGIYRGTNYYTSQLDNLYYNAFMMSGGTLYYSNASAYEFGRSETGYIGEYDFNISGNVNDRVYLGLTVGLHDVHYNGRSLYAEHIVDGNDKPNGVLTVSDERRITGTGYNVAAGVIFRPVEESPFRVGLYVSTPTWYDLTSRNNTYLINDTPNTGDNPSVKANNSYDFKVYTPWKFGLSLGHTIGSSVALGATYEYSDYGSMDTRINDGTYEDWYGDVYTDSHSDDEMNRHTKETLKGVSTLKIGAEYKPVSSVALRIGYNYLTPMYKKDGFKNGGLDSYGSNYSSATDYTNWKATNRFTLGFGYVVGKFSADLAYQYTMTDGDFYPFMDAYTKYVPETKGHTVSLDNTADAVKVSNKRNQLLLTLTYKF